MPGLKPAYSFLLCGFCMLFLHDETGKPMLTWKYAERSIMWGMMFLFASGMALGLDPVACVLIVIVAANCAYVLPVSTRAIPVGFGLEAATQIRLGLRLTVLNMIATTLVGYVCLQFLPQFGQL